MYIYWGICDFIMNILIDLAMKLVQNGLVCIQQSMAQRSENDMDVTPRESISPSKFMHL